MKQYFHIAIDGPVGVGKSTTARKIAEKLGYLYIDTGAMYRVITYLSLKKNISIKDKFALIKLAKTSDIDIRLPNINENDGRQSTVLVNGLDVSWEIRKGKINKLVAHLSKLSFVRKILVKKQQYIASKNNVVMEGRDITSIVLPNADLKIYLDASQEIRQKRYYISRINKKKNLSLKQISSWLEERDSLDKNRKISPLKIVPDAWYLDTSNKTINQVVDEIIQKHNQVKKSL